MRATINVNSREVKMEKNGKKKSKKALIIYAFSIAIIAGIVAIVIFALTNKRETHTYVNRNNGETSGLKCTIDKNDNAFFVSDLATELKHTIKIMYNDNNINKVSYEYDGIYDSAEEAKKDVGKMHTNYNIYMGDHGVDHEILTPVFQYDEKKARIRLYLDDYRKMNSTIGKVFYIGSGIQDTIAKESIEETKKIFENKGFSCIISD